MNYIHLKDAVHIRHVCELRGYVCLCKQSAYEDDVLGWEDPEIAAHTIESRNTIPACEVCFRHALSYSALVRHILGFNQARVQSTVLDVGFVRCEWCGSIRCRQCDTEEYRREHAAMCHHGDASRKQLRDELDSLIASGFGCLMVVAKYLSRKRSSGLASLPEYFKPWSYNMLTPSTIHAGHRVVTSLLGWDDLPLSIFQRVVDTFDRTNLFVEIAHPTMLDEMENGVIPSWTQIELLDILRSSPFPVLDDSSLECIVPVVAGTGHYPTIARMNHSCDPNVEWESVDGSNRIQIVALRDIRAGEEVCISYIDQDLGYAERQQLLRDLYGFDCCCTKCELEG